MTIDKDIKELELLSGFEIVDVIKKKNTYQIIKLSAIVNILIELNYSQKNICRNLKLKDNEYLFYVKNKIISTAMINKIKNQLIEKGINHDYKLIFNN